MFAWSSRSLTRVFRCDHFLQTLYWIDKDRTTLIDMIEVLLFRYRLKQTISRHLFHRFLLESLRIIACGSMIRVIDKNLLSIQSNHAGTRTNEFDYLLQHIHITIQKRPDNRFSVFFFCVDLRAQMVHIDTTTSR